MSKTRKEAEKRHEIKVGVTILVSLAVLVFAILSVGQQRGILADQYKLYCLMTRVNGLQTGAPVRLSGVRVGSVIGVEFQNNQGDPKIKVTLEIDKKVQERIRVNSKAHIGTLGLLGDKFIGITMGSLDQPVLEEGDLLDSADPVDIEALLSEGVDAVQVLRSTINSINSITAKVDEGEGTLGMLINDPRIYIDVDRILAILEDLSAKLNSGEGTLSKVFNDSTMYVQLNDFLASTTALSDTIRNGDGTLSKLVKDPQLYDELVATSQRLKQITQKIDESEGTLGELVNDKKLYDDLTHTTASLDSLINAIIKNPKKYLTLELF